MTIKTLILQGEGEQLDFKNKISSCEKIAKTLVAFANNKGGKLLVGVADDGMVKGVKNEEEEKYMLQRAGNLYCRPAIEPSFEEVYVDDKLVLVVDIDESDTKPHYALDENKNWWVYIRVADKSLLAGKVTVDVLHRKNGTKGTLIRYTDKEKKLLAYLQAHPKSPLPELSASLRLSKREIRQMLVNLILADVITVHHDDHQEYYAEKSI
ncbi:ATP-binding protein [Parapedobacter lycopersici]|uniref:AlbA family DNA-binding domain-containing protein n=1 Tax=Parapedobacter lycopersici TaxID=1864939 RepID=UPI00333F2CF9